MARADISYNFEDFGKDTAWLQAKYADTGHPEYTRAQWRQMQLDDQDADYNGYWDWVMQAIAKDDDAIPDAGTAQEVVVGQGDIVDIDSIDVFAAAIGNWHANRVARLKNMLGIPAGTEVELAVGDTRRKLTLEGDTLLAFQLGLKTALAEFEELPFVASVETAEGDPDAAAG